MCILQGQIEFNWPGKELQIHHNGKKWVFADNLVKQIHSLVYDSTIGEEGDCKGYAIKGDFITALECLASYTPSSLQMVYFDSPRLSVLQDESLNGFSDSTWLSIVHKAACLATKILKYTGYFVLHTDEDMSHYARMVLDEVFGRNHHITTFAWQKKYSPQNDPGKKNPTDAYDCIIVYSKAQVDEINKIGIIEEINIEENSKIIDDGDWRGVYTANHKGAKSGNETTKFKVNAPPYHWEIVESKLPEGRYCFDRFLGVLWFESIKSVGNYWVKVKATDSVGNEAEGTINFESREPHNYSEDFELPEKIWWLMKNDNAIISSGQLKVLTDEVPEAIKGCQYSLVFKAVGGTPFKMKDKDSPGEGRYWEFAQKTLVHAIAKASALFGKRGISLPARKKFFKRDDNKRLKPITNWLPWLEFGKTENATKHINELASAGITKAVGPFTAKPQKLLHYLISLLAPDNNDIVLSIGDSNAAFASVAIKSQHKFIHITGGSTSDLKAWEDVGLYRLAATLENKDSGSIEADDEIGFDYKVSDGYIDVLCISKNALKKIIKTGSLIPIFAKDECIEDYYAGLVGGYRKDRRTNVFQGFNGETIIVLDSDDTLDSTYVSQVGATYQGMVRIIAERCEEFKIIPENVTILHAPYDLIENYE